MFRKFFSIWAEFLLLVMVSNVAIAYTEVSGNVSGETWGPGTYLVTGDLIVDDNTTLTIQAGAVVKFKLRLVLQVNGTLDVNGTDENNMVVFTSYYDDDYGEDTDGDAGDPSPGDWEGILLSGYGDLEGYGYFDWCRIRYGGNTDSYPWSNVIFSYSNGGHFYNSISEYSAGVGVEMSNFYDVFPTFYISRSTFSNNASIGLSGGTGVIRCFITNNTFTNNGDYGAFVAGFIGDCYGNQGTGHPSGHNGILFDGQVGFGHSVVQPPEEAYTWSTSNNFPIFLYNLLVAYNATLTLAAGTIIKMPGAGGMEVQGTLNANGTSSSPIIFTAGDDDDYGEDPIGRDPFPGSWGGIYLHGDGAEAEGVGNFNWCRFRYGGNPSYSVKAAVYFEDSYSGRLTNSIIEYSGYDGVRVKYCSPTLRGNLIENNTRYGIYIESGGAPDLGANDPSDKGNNTIRDNDSGNFQLYNDSANTIKAYYNFWGYTTATEIDAHIYDDDENPGKGKVFFDPWLYDPVTHYWAVIVGVADYPGTGDDLKYSDDDAMDIKNSLLLYSNWSDENIQLLLDSEATRSNIQTAIENMSKMASKDDVCLFFFSGHGTNNKDIEPIDESDGVDEYICSYGSTIDEYIRDDELSDWLGALPTTNVVVIVDASYSGGQIKVKSGFTPKVLPNTKGVVKKGDGFATDITRHISVKDMDDNEGCVVLTACDDDETSWEFRRLENGLFSYFVVGGLEKNVDKNGNGELSAEEIGKYARFIVNLLSNKLPFLKQHPQLYDDYPADAPESDELSVCIGEPQPATVIHDEKIENIIGLASPAIIAVPQEAKLWQNYSNPFNPDTWIPYQLSEGADVKIRIYNVSGQLVRVLELGHKQAGYYLTKAKAAYWDGRDNLGEKVASGVYFYTLQAGEFRNTRRMVIMK